MKNINNFLIHNKKVIINNNLVFFIIYVLEICIRVAGHNIVNFLC